MTSVHEGLLIDIGGVLTTDVIAAFDEFCAREGLSGISIRDLYYNSAEAQRLFHRLELGEVDPVEAQPQLASILGLPETRSDNLFRDLYTGVHLVPDMTRSVEVLHASGVRTGVLSNSRPGA
jgi:putative hydrolase of the HAD superfamily